MDRDCFSNRLSGFNQLLAAKLSYYLIENKAETSSAFSYLLCVHKTTLMKKHLLALVLAASACAPSLSAQSFVEGSDFPSTGTGPAFITYGPSITISGTLNTPGDGQDRFQVTIPAGCQVTSVSWTMTDTANLSVSGFAQFGLNNQENIPPLNGSFANGPFLMPFPVSSGTYDCIMGANVAANDSWSMTFYSDCPTGIATVNFAEPATVYPNPVADVLYLDGIETESEFVLINALGEIVFTQTIYAAYPGNRSEWNCRRSVLLRTHRRRITNTE